VVKDGVDDGVSPCSTSEEMVSDPAFLDHPDALHDVCRTNVIGGTCAPDSVKTKVMKSKVQKEQHGLTTEATTPVVRM